MAFVPMTARPVLTLAIVLAAVLGAVAVAMFVDWLTWRGRGS
jgi:hypothetical protein